MAYDKERVARRLKSLRADLGYDQQKLADLSGIPLRTIVSYETATAAMGMENAVKLADALECTLDELSCRNDFRKEES